MTTGFVGTAGSQLKDHVYERSRHWFAAGDAARDAITTMEMLRTRQDEIRRAVLAGIGGLPPSDTSLNARVTGTVPGNGFTIEKVIFETRPKHYVTANLYLPEQRTGRTAAVLFLCGHHATAKTAPEYQAVCQTLVRAGLIVLAQDPIGHGERDVLCAGAGGGSTQARLGARSSPEKRRMARGIHVRGFCSHPRLRNT